MFDAYPVRHGFSSLIEERIKPLMRPTFIETGTNLGEGIAVALRCGAQRVYSCEADPKLHAEAVARYADHPHVFIERAASPTFLRHTLGWLAESALIYLDAHGYDQNPLLDELATIAERAPRFGHTIAIDDVRMFGTADWFGLTKAEAVAALMRIDPRYVISYVDTNNAPRDLLVARLPE